MDCNILDLYEKRHSFYNINKACPLNKNRIEELVKDILKLYPSPYNSQSARTVLLFNDKHTRLWDITRQKLFAAAPEDTHSAINKKISGFTNGYGTVLFFIDKIVVQKQQEMFPLYAENFANWANQSNAILQFMIWTALANVSVGASLQHYNPLISDEIKKAFHLPENWELTAEMPFGGIGKVPEPHPVDDTEKTLIVLH